MGGLKNKNDEKKGKRMNDKDIKKLAGAIKASSSHRRIWYRFDDEPTIIEAKAGYAEVWRGAARLVFACESEFSARTVEGDYLASVLKAGMPRAIDADGDNLHIEDADGVKHTLATKDATLPPTVAPAGIPVRLDIPALRKVFKKIEPFASTDETRSVICCLRLRARGGQLLATATDSYRLVLDYPLPNVTEPEGFEELLLPAAAVKLLLACLPTGHNPAVLYPDGTLGALGDGWGLQLKNTRQEGYPNVERVVPEEYKYSMYLYNPQAVAKKLAAACKSLGVRRTNSTDFRLTLPLDSQEETTLYVEHRGEERKLNIPIILAGKRPGVGQMQYNPQFFLDALALVDDHDDTVEIGLNAPNGPTKIGPSVLMPIPTSHWD